MVKLHKPTNEELAATSRRLGTWCLGVVRTPAFWLVSLASCAVGMYFSLDQAYLALGGYLDTSEWATQSTLTNWTIGFALVWLGLGACLGLLLRKWKVPMMLRPIVIAVILFMFAYGLHLLGMEGFAFA